MVGVKVVQSGVLYSCVKFRRLKMGDPVYNMESIGSHETGSTAKKVTASDSAKPGPHIHIFLSQRSRVRVEMGTKSEKVCICVCVCISKVHGHFWLKFGLVLSMYGALMLLNFCGNQGMRLGARTKLFGVSN